MSEQTTSQTQQPLGASAAVPTGKPAGKGIILSDSAVKRLRLLLEQRQTPEAGLRLAVKGGGCSGLQYAMEWAEKARERDKVFEREGVRVFVDPKSYLYLMGTELVFEETLMGSGFKLQNPNVKGACGCGESFTI
jgi:iron-sulfur cluster assembly protein